MSTGECGDEDLYLRWCQGISSPQASETWECLYRRHREDLVLYCQSLSHDFASAEDCAEEAFVRLLRPRLLEGSFKTYLWRAARNITIDQARQAHESALEHDPASTDCDPPGRLAAKEDNAAIARCLEKLEPTNRELVLLKACHRFTFEEAGRVAGLARAVSTIKSAYDKALAALRRCLEKTSF